MTSFMGKMNLSPHIMGDLCVAVYEMINSFEKKMSLHVLSVT